MFGDSKPYTFDRVVRGLLTALALVVLVWVLRYLSDVLIPFAVALLLAYLLNPIVTRLEARLKSRALAVGITLVGVAVAMAGLLLGVIPLVIDEAQRLGLLLKQLLVDSDMGQRAAGAISDDLWQSIQAYIEENELDKALLDLDLDAVVGFVYGKLLPGAWGVVQGVLGFVFALIGLTIIGLYLVFLLLDYPKVREGWKSLLPPAWREPAANFLAEADAAMHRYFRAQATVAAIVGVLFAIGFEIVGLPLGILLGLLIGLLNMVPYLQIVGLIPAFILAALDALATGGNVWLALGGVALVFAIVQTIQDGLLVPKIMGPAMGLNPAVVLLSLSIWGKLLGLLGLLIALPATCLLLAWWRRMLTGTATPGTATLNDRSTTTDSSGEINRSS